MKMPKPLFPSLTDYTEDQLIVALARYEEFGTIQEQNIYLDKVASELQDLCDRQAFRLASQEVVMKQALEALKVYKQGFRCPYTAPAIKALEEALK